MANSILKDKQGPDWPLGFVGVVTPGVPVGLMSVVDPNSYNSPNTPTGANVDEYTVRAQQIFFQAIKPNGAGSGWVNNTGNVYIVRKGTGSSNYNDTGVLVKRLVPGENFFLASAAFNLDVFSPYRYYVDADNAGDGVAPTLLIQ
jgi:hypothetical protein